MARQHIHNRRAARGSTGGGASWISYSDMMAALLLIFVLILSYSLYQYFTMLETKTAELESQRVILVSQQDELEQKENALIIIRADLDTLQTTLSDKQAELDTLQDTLSAKQIELDSANSILIIREKELDSLQTELADKQIRLDAATARLSEQQAALDAQAVRIDDLVGVRSQSVHDLSAAFSSARLEAAVDPNTGAILLNSTVFFEFGKSEIREEGKQLLNDFIPVYLNVLLSDRYADYLGEIIIEGHTDSSGTYNGNLRLSQERALQVAMYCINMPSLSRQQRAKLQQILTATGRASADLKYDSSGNEDPDASRRVEFKFSLKDAEMIDEMNRILHDNSN